MSPLFYQLLRLILPTFCVISLTLTTMLTLGAPVHAQNGDEPTVKLYSGWNNVLYQGIALPVSEALGDALADVSLVWKFDAPEQEWQLWSSDLIAELNKLTDLEPGEVVFLHSRLERLWTQPLTQPVEPTLPSATGLWEVTFTRTTVLFDLQETIQFDETGLGTVTTAQGASSGTTVSTNVLLAVDQDLRNLSFFRSWPPDTRSGCLSCFHFNIAIRAPDGTQVTLETDGVGATEQLMGLTNQLTSILLSALQ